MLAVSNMSKLPGMTSSLSHSLPCLSRLLSSTPSPPKETEVGETILDNVQESSWASWWERPRAAFSFLCSGDPAGLLHASTQAPDAPGSGRYRQLGPGVITACWITAPVITHSSWVTPVINPQLLGNSGLCHLLGMRLETGTLSSPPPQHHFSSRSEPGHREHRQVY